MGEGLVTVLGDDNTLARREAVLLDDVGRAERIHGVSHLLDGRAHVGEPGRDVGSGHDVLGEGLAALEAGRVARRSEDVEATVSQHVGDAGDEGSLGTDDHEVRGMLLGDRQDRSAIGDVREGLTQRERVDAWVARRGDDRVDGLVLHEATDDGVLAGTGADDKDLHGRQA